jgi:CubicO group peptidase (beta-lactamase class C family)
MAQFGRMRIIAIALTALFSATLSAQAPAPAASSATFDPGRAAVIDRGLQRYVDSGRVPGIVALVMQDGKVVYEKAFGWADKENDRRMTTDAIFRIASQTKALTSAAVMQLVEEGLLTLNTRVGTVIPSFAKTTVAVAGENGVTQVPARRPITVRDLLTHTAGISYGTDRSVAAMYEAKGLGPAAGFGWYTADKDEPVCDTMERLGTLPFVAQPGEAWVYGYNTDVLGCIVEKASGTSLDAYIRDRITAPLGMKDTQFFLPPSAKPRLAAVYASGADGKFERAPNGARGQGDYVEGPRRNFAGGAGLLSTARDYARFLEAMRRGGSVDGVRILSPLSVKLMSTNQVGTLHSTTGLGFGLGFETVDRFGANGMSGEGAFGWGGAYGSVYRVDPAARLVMVLMIQVIPNATDIRDVFPSLVYQALK